jgi:hypothetical protein
MYSPVHPDDLPSERTIKLSEILLRQLEAKIKHSFYQSCVRLTRIRPLAKKFCGTLEG